MSRRQAEDEAEDDVLEAGGEEPPLLLSPQDIANFQHGFTELKEDMTAKMGNISCVMKRMNYMKEDNTINIEYYRDTRWKLVIVYYDVY